MNATSNKEKFSFQTEVGRLLEIVASSLYSNREIFLRELISNASDACDKLRHAVLTIPSLIEGDPDFRIELALDTKAKTITVSDNGNCRLICGSCAALSIQRISRSTSPARCCRPTPSWPKFARG